ncbi:MAG: MraY family glycosyltransferase [Bacteroidales bacterium]|nr:MraY family glycosyltransferase [Bacteroidales bacterium]
MGSIESFYFHLFQPEYRIATAFILAIILNLYVIPIIIRIARQNNFFDVPNQRTSHETSIPTMGGLGIYFSIIMVSLILINTCGLNGGQISSSLTSLPPILAGLTLIFFVGMKDDIINIGAWKKLVAEIIALIILIVIGDVKINNLQGIFGINELNYIESLIISLFVGIVIINALNLIDGVDGLASSIALLGSSVFGSYFLVIHEWEYAIFAFTISGALIPFFIYNSFGKVNKIFMGDTGSLLLGFAMTVLVFRFNEMNSMPSIKPYFIAGPAFSIAVLIVPLFDTLRVFSIRIYRGGSPFKADHRHIHHVLLDLGFTHLQTTAILFIISVVYIVFTYFFNYLGNYLLILIMIGSVSLLAAIAMKIHYRKLRLNLGEGGDKPVESL